MRERAPLHPGTYLRYECQERNLTSTELAQILEWDCAQLEPILQGQHQLPVGLAQHIQHQLGIPMDLLLHLQKDHDALKETPE